MADFTMRVYGIQGQLTYDPTPTLASGALAVKQASYVGPYTRTGSGFLYSPATAELPYIPASDIPNGSKWLLFYSASMGATDTTDKPQVWCYQSGGASADRDFGMGFMEGVSHGSPEYMRAGHMGGFIVFTSNGNDVGFSIRNVVGGTSPNYYGGMNLVAVPLASLVEGADYWYAKHATNDEDPTAAISSSADPGSYFDLVTLPTFTVPESGAYLVLGCCAGGASSVGTDIKARLSETNQSGTLTIETQTKENADADDHQPFEFMEIRSFSAGDTVSYSLQGLSSVLPVYKYYQPRLLVIRLNAFRSHAYASTDTTVVPVTLSHPAYQEVLSTDFTPYQTTEGEHALVLGKCIGWRTNSAATVARLRDKWSTEPFHRFCTTVNTSGTNTDRSSLFCFGAPLINFEREYAMEISAESGYATMPNVQSARLCVIGLTPRTTPTGNIITLTIGDDTPPLGESGAETAGGVGGTTFPEDIHDSGAQNSFDTVDAVVTVAPEDTIPVAHPRLWIYNNDRVTYWQSRAFDGNRPWDMLKTSRARRNAFANVMAWMASGTTSYLTEAITQIDTELANADASWPTMNNSGPVADDGVGIRDYARNMALCYDWLYDHPSLGETRKRKMEDYLLCLAMLNLNPRSSFCSSNFPLGYNDPTSFASSNITNNHYVASTTTMTYVALALKHHHPATVGFPLGTTDPSKRVQFSLPRYWNQANGGGAYFSDSWEFLQDRLPIAIPEWTPKAEGGGWHEGLNYGRGAIRNMTEVFLLLRDTAGLDYLSSTFATSLGESGIHWISYYQPGVAKLYCSGDNTTNDSTWASDYDRMVLLFHAEAYRGTLSGRCAQYFLTNDRPYMGNGDGSGGESSMQCMDFFYYRHDAPSTVYSTVLPTTRYTPGIGYVSSRNQWGTAATNFTFSSQEQIQGHMHEDQNSLQIFKGNGAGTAKEGWLLCEVMANEADGTGETTSSHYHSTITVYDETTLGSSGWTQRGNFSPGNNGLGPVGEIDRQVSDSTVYGYALGECDDAYWQTTDNITGSQVVSQINDIWKREFVHLKSPNTALVYDRFRVKAEYAAAHPTTAVEMRWWYLFAPTSMDASTIRSDSTVGTLFRKNCITGSVQTPITGSSDGVTYERIRFVLSSRYGRALTAFQVKNPAAVAMDSHVHVPAISGGDMEGVSVFAPSPDVVYHVLFSALQDGSTPTTTGPTRVRYEVFKNGSDDKHLVFNLVPGQEYFVAEADGSVAGYKVYTVTETFNSGFTANSGGVLEFTPADIPGQEQATILRIDDAGVGASESSVDTSGSTTTVSIDDSATTNADDTSSTFIVTTSGTTAHVVDILDFTTTNSESATNFSETLTINDSGTADDSGIEVEVTRLYLPKGTYAEKAIRPAVPFLYTNGDRGASFAYAVPSDQALYDVLQAGGDDSYMRFVTPQPSFMALAYAAFNLDDPTPFYSRVRSIRFVVRIRKLAHNVANPVLVLKFLKYVPFEVEIAKYNLPLSTVPIATGEVLEVASPAFAINESAETIRDSVLKIEPRATSYGSVYDVEVSMATVEILAADSTEKRM